MKPKYLISLGNNTFKSRAVWQSFKPQLQLSDFVYRSIPLFVSLSDVNSQTQKVNWVTSLVPEGINIVTEMNNLKKRDLLAQKQWMPVYCV